VLAAQVPGALEKGRYVISTFEEAHTSVEELYPDRSRRPILSSVHAV
jgi:hypothetical protein